MPSDKRIAAKGDAAILEYDAFRFFNDGLIISNGRQSARFASLDLPSAQEQLERDLAHELYEPDAYKTPRITGCYRESESGMAAALHIVRSNGAAAEKKSWNLRPSVHQGWYIATYQGADVRPTPSFAGDPVPFEIRFGSADQAAKAAYDSLAPQDGQPDYRVAVIAVYKKPNQEPEISIINRKEVE
jgi:IMP cyclohydrolase